MIPPGHSAHQTVCLWMHWFSLRQMRQFRLSLKPKSASDVSCSLWWKNAKVHNGPRFNTQFLLLMIIFSKTQHWIQISSKLFIASCTSSKVPISHLKTSRNKRQIAIPLATPRYQFVRVGENRRSSRFIWNKTNSSLIIPINCFNLPVNRAFPHLEIRQRQLLNYPKKEFLQVFMGVGRGCYCRDNRNYDVDLIVWTCTKRGLGPNQIKGCILDGSRWEWSAGGTMFSR